tara:strand:+ start:923 stop:2716 length:1794 start_codon:yes stop_codon:yes gene_type:complete
MVFRQQPNPDADEAARIGREAAERVQEGREVPPDWQVGGLAEQMIEDVVVTKWEFTTDDIWERLEDEIAQGNLQEPNERRILGAVMQRLASNGIIQTTDFNKPSTRRNAAPIRVWRVNPQFAYRKWREWGAYGQLRDERVTDAKRGLDESIQANEERLIRAQEDIERLQEMIDRDRTDSGNLRRRGYDRKRMPSMDEVIESADLARKELERNYSETDRVVIYEWNETREMKGMEKDVLYHNLQPFFELEIVDSSTGEKIAEMRLASKSEDGSIGRSATGAIIGYQEIDLATYDVPNAEDRARLAVRNWFNDTIDDGTSKVQFVGGPSAFTGKYEPIGYLDFFPANLSDRMLERERSDLRDLDMAIEGTRDWRDPFAMFGSGDTVFDGSMTWDDLMDSPILGNRPRYDDYIMVYPNGFLSQPEVWVAYNQATRDAIIKLEAESAKGDLTASSLLESMRDAREADYIENLKQLQDADVGAWAEGMDEEDYQLLREQLARYASHYNERFRLANESYPDEFVPVLDRKWEPTSISGTGRESWRQKRYERRISNQRFIGSRRIPNKQNASYLANRVRNMNRYARIIPCSGGWRVYVGPRRKV